jgi:hypothetical protein
MKYIPTEYNPSVFHRELQNIYGILPHSPTTFWRLYRHLIPTESPTDCRTHVWHVSVCMDTNGIADVSYRRTHRRLTHVWHVSVCKDTDDIADVPYRRLTHVWHVSVCTIIDGTSDVKYRRHHRRRTHVWHVSVCTITDGISDGVADGSKSLVGFSNFFGAHFN